MKEEIVKDNGLDQHWEGFEVHLAFVDLTKALDRVADLLNNLRRAYVPWSCLTYVRDFVLTKVHAALDGNQVSDPEAEEIVRRYLTAMQTITDEPEQEQHEVEA